MLKIFSSKKNLAEFHSYFSYVFWLFGVFIAIMSIGTAMFIQFVVGDLPCPLCLLQRIAFFGFTYGALLHFKGSSRFRSIGISLLFIVLLQIMSLRQSLIDIYPRPGHAWIGSAIFGIHLPIWSFIGALMLVLAISLDFIFIARDNRKSIEHYPGLNRIANIFAVIVLLLCAVNLVAVFFQCGFHVCHTFGYELLK